MTSIAKSNRVTNTDQRTTGMSQRNSFVSLAEELTALNKNTVEVTTKLNDIVSSRDSAVSIVLTDADGNTSEYYMPTVGFLKKEIDKINNNIKRLSGIESTSNVIDGKSVKKVYTVDINREPYPISEIGDVVQFEPVNNSFFESLMNPLLAIELDISDKVTSDVNKILSRRYIVKFERNKDFTLTSDGLKSYNSFHEKFLNRTDVDINEFIDWYNEELNVGILKDVVEPYDEQIFDLSVNEVNDHGLFSVIKTETDTLNKKFWYHLNTLNYYTKEGYDKSLAVGDSLILNRLNSSTRWIIKEVNTEASNYRVSLERAEGYDPVPIGTNVLSYYSDITYRKKVKITIGFDEFCVLFIKPINTENNVISTSWSKGTSFYSNDLILITDDNTDLAEYYLRSVYDYGRLLRDMILKKIPTEYAEKPTSPTLNQENFKVVQINKHITDTENTRVLRNLHSQKLSSKSKLSQINSAIVEKNKEINTTNYSTQAEANTAKSELKKLIDEQDNETKTLSSVVSQIGAKVKDTSTDSKFRVRGFWDIPQPIYNGKTEPQHVVQFRVQYRYSSKTGEINPTEGFKLRPTANAEKGNTDGRVVIVIPPVTPNPTGGNTTGGGESTSGGGTAFPIISGDIRTSTVVQSDETTQKEKTAYFSNWNEFISDVRKRYWDAEKGRWYWRIEDVEDADTPNINQLDIPIKPNEKVEVRVKSISEVGWPDSKIESDWSDILTVQFPDELDNILDENKFILKEASQDETMVSMESSLNSRGVFRHIQDSFYVNESYYAHTDKGIQSSFRDDNGNYVNVYEYLQILTDRVTELEDEIKKAKGEFSVFLHTPYRTQKVDTGGIYNIVVELEDYSTLASGTTSREYYNAITLIDDFYIEVKNTSSSVLNLLSNRKYESSGYPDYKAENTFFKFWDAQALTVDYNGDMYTQFDNQFVWFSDNSGGDRIYSGMTAASQSNPILSSANFNIGWSGTPSPTYYSPKWNIISDVDWTGTGSSADLYATVHPFVYNSSDLVESGQDKKKPLNGGENEIIKIFIYFKLDGNKSDTSTYKVPTLGTSPDIRYRKIKMFIEPETVSRPFEFEVKFKLKQYREALYQSSDYNGSGGSTE